MFHPVFLYVRVNPFVDRLHLVKDIYQQKFLETSFIRSSFNTWLRISLVEEQSARPAGKSLVCVSGSNILLQAMKCDNKWYVNFIVTFSYPWNVTTKIVLGEHFSSWLESSYGCFWLFAPKFWQVAGTYKSLFCLKMNAAWDVVTMWGGVDTQTITITTWFIQIFVLGRWRQKLVLMPKFMCARVQTANLHNLLFVWVTSFKKVQKLVFPDKFW